VCENIKVRDPSTTRGIAVMSLYVTQWQSIEFCPDRYAVILFIVTTVITAKLTDIYFVWKV
jgi:hypothetical protein